MPESLNIPIVRIATPMCIQCGKGGEVQMTRDAFDAWQGGAYIQTVAPEMPKGLREQLVTGTHPDCWDEMWADEDED